MARVLVVEDEPIIASDIEEILRGMGHEVVGGAATGREAIACAARTAPEVVLMDIRLKGEMDGIEAAREICQEESVPVIFLTAFADEDTIQRAVQSEPYGYLVKPLDDRELRSALAIALYRSRADRMVRERQHWFVTTMCSLSESVIATDPGQRVVFMNPSAERLTGWSAEEAAQHDLSTVVQLRAKDDELVAIADVIHDAVARKNTISVSPDVMLVTRDGRLVPVDDTVSPIVDDRGHELGAAVVLRDVSVRQELDLQLRMADRINTLGTVAAGTAHEINNPLTSVQGNIELALMSLPEHDADPLPEQVVRELRTCLADALDSSRRIAAIVQDLRLFSRKDEEQSGPVDVRLVLESAIRMAWNEIRHRAQLNRVYEDVPMAEVNEGRLCQVFVNLLVNAAQALEGSERQDKEITLSIQRGPGGGVAIVVADNGPGFSPQVLHRLFSPFVTTKPVGVGTGLGLSICKRIVESFHGTISVESERGRGAAVHVLLPEAAWADPAVTFEPPPKRATERHGRVLVVDDDPSVRRALERILMPHHDVTLCADGAAALARTRDGETFDAIFCDVMMPGVSGSEYFESLMELDPAQAERVIFITGGAFTQRAREFLAKATNEQLEKPFRVGSVLAAVNRRLVSA